MEAQVGACVVGASLARVVEAEILDVAEHMAVPVLHHAVAEIDPDAHETDGVAFKVEPVDRKVLQHHHAASVLEFVVHVVQRAGELADGDILARHVDARQAGLAEGRDGGHDVVLIALRQRVGPVLDRSEPGGLPAGRIDHGLHGDGGRPLCGRIGAEIGHGLSPSMARACGVSLTARRFDAKFDHIGRRITRRHVVARPGRPVRPASCCGPAFARFVFQLGQAQKGPAAPCPTIRRACI